MLDLTRVDVVVFDILGTLVDYLGGVQGYLADAIDDPPRVDALLALWKTEMARLHGDVVAGRRPYAPGAVFDEEVARVVAATARLEEPGVVCALVRAAAAAPARPDASAGLSRVAESRKVIGLSNADTATLGCINATAGLRWHLALSTELVRSFKPDPAVYRLALDASASSPDRVLMVAAHAWDLRGAQAAGMRTAYLERPGGDEPAAGDRFDLRLESLADLARGLEG